MTINWDALQTFANTLLNHPQGPGGVPAHEWQQFADTLETLQLTNDYHSIIRLRRICRPLLARDSAWGIEVLRCIDNAAIMAAHTLNDAAELGHLYGARGHNLHREGKHAQALQSFVHSVQYYEQIANSRAARKNTYMQALCYRALGELTRAKQIVEDVLAGMSPDDDDWRDEPLFMLAKFAQDNGDYCQAEQHMQAAITAIIAHNPLSARHADLLANLAELIGLQARYSEATVIFAQSMDLLQRYPGQYDRLIARTLTKHATMLVTQGNYQQALKLLDQADDRISRYGRYYEQIWRIELLRSAIYLRQGKFYVSWRKYRIARLYAQDYTDVTTYKPTQWLLRAWHMLSARFAFHQ